MPDYPSADHPAIADRVLEAQAANPLRGGRIAVGDAVARRPQDVHALLRAQGWTGSIPIPGDGQ